MRDEAMAATLAMYLAAAPLNAGELAKREAQNTGKDTTINMVVARAPDDARVKHDVLHGVSRNVEDKVDDGFDDKYGADKDVKEIMRNLVNNFYANSNYGTAEVILKKIASTVKNRWNEFAYTKNVNPKTKAKLKKAQRLRRKGSLLINQGNAKGKKYHTKAEKMYNVCLAMDSTNPEIYNALGIIFNFKGNNDKSIEMFRKAYELESRNCIYALSLGQIHEKNNNPLMAYFFFRVYSMFDPQNAKKEGIENKIIAYKQRLTSD